jgi:hypothetical protein
VYQEGAQQENQQPTSGRSRLPDWASVFEATVRRAQALVRERPSLSSMCYADDCHHDSTFCPIVEGLYDQARKAKREHRELMPALPARTPVPAGLEKCDTGRFPFLIAVTHLSPLAHDVAMTALDSAMFNEPTRHNRQRVSGIRLPASLLAKEWGINPNQVRRAIDECVQAEVLHIEDAGHFVSTSDDPEPMRSMRVTLVGNKTGMRAAGRAFKRSGYAAAPSTSGDSTSAGTSRTGSPSGDQRRFNVLTTDATVSAMEAGAW